MDTRDLSFAKRALLENQHAKEKKTKKHPHSQWVWVKVMLADGTLNWYQLPKDLQKAIGLELKNHNANWKEYLDGGVINVPISDYDSAGNVDLTCGMIVDVKRLKKHTSNPRRITRSQFLTADSIRVGQNVFTDLIQHIGFLGHDFTSENKLRISKAYIRVSPEGREILANGTKWYDLVIFELLVLLVGTSIQYTPGTGEQVRSLLSVIGILAIAVPILLLALGGYRGHRQKKPSFATYIDAIVHWHSKLFKLWCDAKFNKNSKGANNKQS